MTIPADSAPSKTLAARIAWLLLIIATLYVCYFSHLGAIGFVGPDEPRYAWIARDMAEAGDWVTPRLYGRPWFEKPPLYYWGAAICFKLFGVSEAAARLPSAISALLATLTMAWLAWCTYGPETARWLLLLLPTTVGMIGFSHAAATDMPFAAMLTIAMVCAAVVLGLGPDPSRGHGAQHAAPLQDEDRAALPRSLALTLLGFFLGLAVLGKGPAGVVLCGGAVFFWAIFTRRWRDPLRLLHPVAIAAFCATALPWYVLCARRNPDFLRIFIIEHNFKRYLTPEFQHAQPFWFYVPVLLAAFLPWTVGVLAALVPPRSQYAVNVFFLSFGLFPVLFFTLSQSKLPGYILPAMPPLALLLAAVVRRPSKSYLAASFAITSILLAITIERFAARGALGADLVPAPWTRSVWSPLLIAGILGVIFALCRRPVACLYAIQLGMLIAAWEFSVGLPWVDPQFSARGVIAASFTDPQSLTSADTFVYDVPRGIHYGLNFYLRREIPEWTSGARGIVFSSRKGQSRLQAEGYVCQQHAVLPAAFLCKQPEGLAAHSPSSRQPQ